MEKYYTFSFIIYTYKASPRRDHPSKRPFHKRPPPHECPYHERPASHKRPPPPVATPHKRALSPEAFPTRGNTSKMAASCHRMLLNKSMRLHFFWQKVWPWGLLYSNSLIIKIGKMHGSSKNSYHGSNFIQHFYYYFRVSSTIFIQHFI